MRARGTIAAAFATALLALAVASGGAGAQAGPPYAEDPPPETTITTAPRDLFRVKPGKTRPIGYAFASNDSGATFLCSFDGAAAAPCASPFNAEVGRGVHGFAVFAVDAAGQADATPATDSFTVKKKKRKRR